MTQDLSKTVEDAERVLNEARTLLRRLQSRKNRRRMKKLYSNRRAMKRMVLKQEEPLAHSLDNLPKSAADETSLFELKSNMEWFLTWRLKLADFPETMWCDGVQDLRLTWEGRRSCRIFAKIWIGPERDTKIMYLTELSGTITLSQNRRGLKGYRLEVQDGGRTYWLRKAIRFQN